jgi:predicted lipoprotein with Yx(FWY)xxD motif
MAITLGTAAKYRQLRVGSISPARSAPQSRGVLPRLALVAAAGLLAACGSVASSAGAGPNTGLYGASGGSPTAGTRGAGVDTRNLPGIGTVLVSESGTTIYSSVQEATGTIKCTGGCLSFWFPVSVNQSNVPRLPHGVAGVLGRIQRADDGRTQLTYNGAPLYTFRLDQAPGQAHGNNFTDHFGATSFTWHAVTTRAGAGTAGSPTSGGSAYPSGPVGY